MKANMSTIDRVVRAIIAIVVAILFFKGIITGVLGIVLLIAAGIFLLTSFISWCPIYAALGIRSNKKPEAQ